MKKKMNYPEEFTTELKKHRKTYQVYLNKLAKQNDKKYGKQQLYQLYQSILAKGIYNKEESARELYHFSLTREQRFADIAIKELRDLGYYDELKMVITYNDRSMRGRKREITPANMHASEELRAGYEEAYTFDESDYILRKVYVKGENGVVFDLYKGDNLVWSTRTR